MGRSLALSDVNAMCRIIWMPCAQFGVKIMYDLMQSTDG